MSSSRRIVIRDLPRGTATIAPRFPLLKSYSFFMNHPSYIQAKAPFRARWAINPHVSAEVPSPKEGGKELDGLANALREPVVTARRPRTRQIRRGDRGPYVLPPRGRRVSRERVIACGSARARFSPA